MKKIIFIIIALLVAGSLLIINKGNLMSKENLMDNTNTYTVIALNGREVKFDKKTNLIVAKHDSNRQLFKVFSFKILVECRLLIECYDYFIYICF